MKSFNLHLHFGCPDSSIKETHLTTLVEHKRVDLDLCDLSTANLLDLHQRLLSLSGDVSFLLSLRCDPKQDVINDDDLPF